jgi:hypothetical protein
VVLTQIHMDGDGVNQDLTLPQNGHTYLRISTR